MLNQRRKQDGRPARIKGGDIAIRTGLVQRARYEMLRGAFEPTRTAEKKLSVEGSGRLIREVWAALYSGRATKVDGPVSGTNPDTLRAARWCVDQILEHEAYGRLAATCKGHTLPSARSALHLAQWVESLDIPKPPEPDADEETQREYADAVDEALGKGRNAEAIARHRLGRALVEAAWDAEDLVSAGSALGLGDDIGTDDKGLGLNLPKMLDDLPNLAKIIRLIGAFSRSLAQRATSYKSRGEREPWSIEPTNRVERLIPSELALLTSPVPLLRLDALRRLSSCESLGFALRSPITKELGDFVVLLDCSGSMRSRMHIAAALAAAAMLAAADDGRKTVLVAFNERARVIGSGLDLKTPEGRINLAKEVLSIRAAYGTDIEAGFVRAVEAMKSPTELRNPDLLLISDGYGNVGHVTKTATAEHDLHYLVIGSGSDVSPVLKENASTFALVKNLTSDDDTVSENAENVIARALTHGT